MSRAAVYNLLANDATLLSYGLSVYGFQAVDTPTTKPFVVLRWDSTQPGVVPTRGTTGLTCWVYDSPADYMRIDDIVLRIKTILTEAVHVSGADGFILTQARWTSDSQDLYDDIYECILRTTSFDVVARPA
jgi:hypothetical protein